MAWSGRPRPAASFPLAIAISLAVGSCSRPSLENELHSAVETCIASMEAPHPINKKEELSDKGFSEITDLADITPDDQEVMEKIKERLFSAPHVGQSDPVAFLMKGDAEPAIYFTWVSFDTTGLTPTKGHSRLCLVGPLADEQTISALQQVADHVIPNHLLGWLDDEKVFASRKIRVHDTLRHISIRDASNSSNAARATYSVNSDFNYLTFYDDALLERAN